jgi:hypothetical protein
VEEVEENFSEEVEEILVEEAAGELNEEVKDADEVVEEVEAISESKSAGVQIYAQSIWFVIRLHRYKDQLSRVAQCPQPNVPFEVWSHHLCSLSSSSRRSKAPKNATYSFCCTLALVPIVCQETF